MDPKIESILVKYLSHCATAEEMDILEKWIDTPEGKARFQQYVKTNYFINYTMNDPDTEQEVEQLLKRIRRSKSLAHRFRTTPYLRYAAVLVVSGMLLAGYFMLDWSKKSKDIQIEPVIVDNAIIPGSEKATLTLEDGSTVVLEEGTTFRSDHATSNGEELVYSKTHDNDQEPQYNYLTVPRGGQFFLTLADGTKVWLNSESQLKYPIAFVEGKTRSIELIYGEAFLEVSPSAEHNGSRFQVDHPQQTVEVLGTEFNIKAYRDESIIYTTLVEGKVSLTYEGNTQGLKPNQQLRYNTENKTTSLSEVNVFDVVSWKEGVFSFDHATLEEIMKVLERWYDMQVVFEDANLKQVEYSGSINKKYEIEEILTALMETGTIRTYEIDKKTIVLK
ncbi:FecR family protein [Flagellimonas sp. SN16]|uniref:FecR family protein n=1 Tax=Flagellimonas sp. SN16 TaxID=3415142 RepID=UPI003C3FBEEE